MKTILVLLLLGFFLQSPAQKAFDEDAFSYATSLLPSGNYKADIMEVDYPNDVKLLMMKMGAAVLQDTTWFLHYMNETAKKGGPMAYDKRLGLTESEFAAMQRGSANGKSFVTVGQETLQVQQRDSLITFHGTGALAPLDSLVIDTRQKSVRLGSTVIPYKNEVHANDKTVVKAWDGHQFRFEEMNNQDLTKINEIKVRSYRLLYGRTQRDGRIFMKLEAKEISNGDKRKDVEISFFLYP